MRTGTDGEPTSIIGGPAQKQGRGLENAKRLYVSVSSTGDLRPHVDVCGSGSRFNFGFDKQEIKRKMIKMAVVMVGW